MWWRGGRDFPDRWGRSGRLGERGELGPGHVLFEEIRVLQPDELDGDAVFEMTHHPSRRPADGHRSADIGPVLRRDRDTGLRNVDHAHRDVDAVRQDQASGRVARRDAAMAAILGQSEDVSVREPGELCGELVPFARRGRDGHREAVLEPTCDRAFEAADMVYIGDDALARLARHRRDQGHAARRHVGNLAGKLAPVRQHVAAEQVDAHTLKPPALFAQRKYHGFFLGKCHSLGTARVSVRGGP